MPLVDRRQPLTPPIYVWRHGYITLWVAILAAVVLLGLHLLLSRIAWLHNLIAFGGSLYLCWMGWQLLWAAARRQALAVADGREHRLANP